MVHDSNRLCARFEPGFVDLLKKARQRFAPMQRHKLTTHAPPLGKPSRVLVGAHHSIDDPPDGKGTTLTLRGASLSLDISNPTATNQAATLVLCSSRWSKPVKPSPHPPLAHPTQPAKPLHIPGTARHDRAHPSADRPLRGRVVPEPVEAAPCAEPAASI